MSWAHASVVERLPAILQKLRFGTPIPVEFAGSKADEMTREHSNLVSQEFVDKLSKILKENGVLPQMYVGNNLCLVVRPSSRFSTGDFALMARALLRAIFPGQLPNLLLFKMELKTDDLHTWCFSPPPRLAVTLLCRYTPSPL